MLVLASLIFYAYHQWELVFLILSVCIADWAFGLWIARSAHPRRALTLGVIFNLSLLAFWKYTPLVLRTIAQLAWALDLPAPIPHRNPPTPPSAPNEVGRVSDPPLPARPT